MRVRLTLLATAVLAVGLAAGSALLFGTLQRTQIATVDAGALGAARDVATLANAGLLPDPVPAGGIGSAFIQVVDAGGRVRAASANADHLVPLLRADERARVARGERLVVPGERAGLDDPMRVVAVNAGPSADRQVVVVAVSLRDVRHGLAALRVALLVGEPVLLVLLALSSWFVVGLTLRPVDALRSGAEEISGTGGSRRLPVPRSRDEVHRLAVTLNDMLGRLEAASDRQRRFVSDAAHELRSPLASIRTQVEVARRLGDFEDTAEGVLDDIERLSRLVDDMLLLARLDEAAGSVRRRVPVDLVALARDLVARYEGSRVPVVLVEDTPVVSTVGDPDGLRRALANLVDNAVRHAVSRVTVRVATLAATPDACDARDVPEGRSGCAELSVSDDGPGIPANQRTRVFDRFTRLDDARSRDSGGAGLGLPIVRDLVRAHNGSVALEDAQPGLRAVIRLPLA